MDREGELARLRSTSAPPSSSRTGTDRIEFSADAPHEVIERVREALVVVIGRTNDSLSLEDWTTVLPGWLLEAFGPEETPEQAETWLSEWRRLPPDEQAAAADARPWALSDWVYWFEPTGLGADRGWAWWDAGVSSAREGWIDVEVEGWPYPSDALRWLLRAAGAVSLR